MSAFLHPSNSAFSPIFGGQYWTEIALILFGCGSLVFVTTVLIYSCIGIHGTDKSLKHLKAEAAAKDEEWKKIEAHYLDRLAGLQQQLHEGLAKMESQVESMQKEVSDTSKEYRAYFSDFAGQVGIEVAKQFSAVEIEPRLEKFRAETAQDYERVGSEAFERYTASQQELYQFANGELQALVQEGKSHAAEWQKKQKSCQKDYSNYLETEKNKTYSEIQHVLKQQMEDYGQSLKKAGSQQVNAVEKLGKAKVSEVNKAFEKKKNEVINNVESTSKSTIEKVKKSGETTIANVKASAAQLQKGFDATSRELRQDCKNAVAECKNVAKGATNAVAEVKMTLTKRLDETDWWVRNNDTDAKKKVTDLKKGLETRIRKLENGY
ncbi:unnamed protein product [Amoebophrya sp. A25]|nr:unnamed protein product [Amoebophrya sp. A25]|eukprot:GSA25T00019433001.1